MKLQIFFCLVALISIRPSHAQNPAVFTKKAIDKKYELRSEVSYVINGKLYSPHERVRIDSALGSYPGEHLIEVSKVRGMNGYKNHEVVMITFAYKQSAKQISDVLETLKGKFPDKYSGPSPKILPQPRNPVLWINNENIHFSKTKETMEKLKAEDIYFIDYKKEPVSPAIYGQNGRNGLVRIWTDRN
jgi:hypothetical protein